MKNYNIYVERDTTEATTVTVLAESQAAATEQVRNMDLSEANWEPTEWVGASTYSISDDDGNIIWAG